MNDRYPIVKDIVPSQQTAGILKNLLYSQDGFLTAHLSYMYQCWIWSTQEKTLGDYIKQLAANDGDILDALGNITVAFGGDPNFSTVFNKNWSTQYLILTKNRNQFLKSALQMENKAIQDLNNSLSKIENDSLKQLLTSIVEDKQNIVKDLTNFLQNS